MRQAVGADKAVAMIGLGASRADGVAALRIDAEFCQRRHAVA